MVLFPKPEPLVAQMRHGRLRFCFCGDFFDKVKGQTNSSFVCYPPSFGSSARKIAV
jgi:hypothetical protein